LEAIVEIRGLTDRVQRDGAFIEVVEMLGSPATPSVCRLNALRRWRLPLFGGVWKLARELNLASATCREGKSHDGRERRGHPLHREPPFTVNSTPGSSVGRRWRLDRQGGAVGVVIRRVRTELPTLESLGLPPIVGDLSLAKRGLILVVGATTNGDAPD
jgi:hypothetical protein